MSSPPWIENPPLLRFVAGFIIIIFFAVNGAEAFLLDDGGHILEHAAVSAEIDREVIRGGDPFLHQPGDPPALAGPAVLRAGERRGKAELGMSPRPGLQLVLIVEVPLRAESPKERCGTGTLLFEEGEQHRTDRSDAGACGDEEVVPRGVIAEA